MTTTRTQIALTDTTALVIDVDHETGLVMLGKYYHPSRTCSVLVELTSGQSSILKKVLPGDK